MTDQELQSLRNMGNECECAVDEIESLRQQVALLRAWQQSAWQRGHAVGVNGLQQVLRQASEAAQADCWGNTQLTEALLKAESDAALWEERARHLGWRDEHEPAR